MPPRPWSAHHLLALEAARLIRRLESESDIEYLFQHALIQEATYASLLRTDRRILHRHVAEAIEAVYADQLEEWCGLLAHHYQQAEIVDKARQYLFQAGEQARARYANADAVRFYTEALALTSADEGESRYAILCGRERVYDVMGERAAQWQDLETLAALLEASPADSDRHIKLTLRQGDYADKTGNYPEAERLARRAIALAEAAPPNESLAQGYFQHGVACWRITDYAPARPLFHQAQVLARTLGLKALEADSLRMLGVLDDSQSNYASARIHFQEALRLKRAIGDRRGEAQALNSLGVVVYHQTHYAEAQNFFEEALRLKRLLGDRLGEISTLHNLSNVLVLVGRLAEAQTYYALEAQACREIRDPNGEASAWLGLGQTNLSLGQFDHAQAQFGQALTLFREVGDREGEADTLAGLAVLARATGRPELALQQAEQAQVIAQEISNELVQGYALTTRGHAWLDLGQPTEAAQAYAEAVRLRNAMNQHSLALESLAGLARARLMEGNLIEAQHLIEEVLPPLIARTLIGLENPTRVYLTACHILRAAHDPRAEHVLAAGHAALLEQAAHLTDETMRRSFLENVPSHRELLKLAMG